MKLLLCAVILFPALALAQTEEQIVGVSISADTVVYMFAETKMMVDLSKIPIADAKFIKTTFWCDDQSNGKFTSCKIMTKDANEQQAVLDQLALFSIAPTKVSIKLTDVQKADVITSQLIDKRKIVKYMKLCDLLRIDNPGWTDLTVRAVAKGGL